MSSKPPQGLDVNDFIRHLCVFIRALGLQRDDLNMSVFLVDSSGDSPANVLLGSTLHECQGSDANDTASKEVPGSNDVCDTLIERLRDIIVDKQKSTTDDSRASAPPWGSALVQALCHVKKHSIRQIEQNDVGVESSRILCIATSQDDSSKYLTFMNAVFASQRDGITIDCCHLGSKDSSLFQQACLLTGGLHMRPARPKSLLEYLMTAYIADEDVRKDLRYPSAQGIDFRASCFCHHTLIDMGYVCSVCLSVFCEKHSICLTCGSEFTI
ncbi:hypothetical protein M9435_006410 [Picochlorum sp. BPE23]|nr:hypothetical protein M9435_006410 [Picochlorum sp. BPE23]